MNKLITADLLEHFNNHDLTDSIFNGLGANVYEKAKGTIISNNLDAIINNNKISIKSVNEEYCIKEFKHGGFPLSFIKIETKDDILFLQAEGLYAVEELLPFLNAFYDFIIDDEVLKDILKFIGSDMDIFQHCTKVYLEYEKKGDTIFISSNPLPIPINKDDQRFKAPF